MFCFNCNTPESIPPLQEVFIAVVSRLAHHQLCRHPVTEVKGIVGLCACMLLKCTNTRERTAQLETYAVLRHEKEECVYMRKRQKRERGG